MVNHQNQRKKKKSIIMIQKSTYFDRCAYLHTERDEKKTNTKNIKKCTHYTKLYIKCKKKSNKYYNFIGKKRST